MDEQNIVIEQVDILDELMSEYRAGRTPDGILMNRAIELGIDVSEVKLVVGGTYGSVYENEDEDGCEQG